MKRSQYAAIAVVALALVITVVTVSIAIGSGDTSGARAQAQAACAIVSEWETNSGKLNTNDMLYSIQQDADKAAAGDHQWQFLAEDATNLKSALIQGQAPLETGVVVAHLNMAFSAAQRQIETDCTHVP